MSEALHPLVRLELRAVNWHELRVIPGRDAAAIPAAVERLLTATSDADADAAYWQLDNRALVQGQLFQASLHLVPVLLAGLAGPLHASARRAALELLVEIALGAPDEFEVALGRSALDEECRHALREGLWLVYGLIADPDVHTRECAMRLVHAVDRDRDRVARVLRWIEDSDPDERISTVLRELRDTR